MAYDSSITATLFGLYFSTRPLFEFPFFSTPQSQPHIQPFFYRRNFSEFCCIHLKFLLIFQIPYLPTSFHYVFLLHLSGSTGSLRPLSDTGRYIRHLIEFTLVLYTSPIVLTQS